MKKQKIAVLGTGHFGTAIGSVIAKNKNYDVVFYTKDQAVSDSLNNDKRNSECFSFFEIDCKASTDLSFVVSSTEIIFIVLPSFVLPDLFKELRNYITKDQIIVLCSKGFNEARDSLEDMIFSNYVQKILPNARISIFSGPSFADGVIFEISTAVTVAGNTFGEINDCFKNSRILLYESSDLIGVQVVGAIKGIIAIKMGILSAFVCNLAKAENIDQEIYNNKIYKTFSELVLETKDIIVAMGGNENTIISPAGIGDITMVCNSKQSRNMRFGIEIGNIIYDKMLVIENGNIYKIKNDFLDDNIPTNILNSSCIEQALVKSGHIVEGYFSIQKLLKILNNITIKSDHFAWICEVFTIN